MTWQSVLTTLGVGLLSVAATVVVNILRQKTARWGRKISDPVIERLNQQLDIWIDDSINTVNKNFVDKLKETGEWDRFNGVFDKETYKKNATEALERSVNSLKSRIPKTFKRLVTKYYDDMDLFYKNRIDERLKEYELKRKKQEEELGKIKEAEEKNASHFVQQEHTSYQQSSNNGLSY